MEKFISPEKILRLSKFFGISDDILYQIVIFTQMKDAIRNTSPRLYRSTKHRQELLDALLDVLEKLEEEREQEEEEREQEEEEEDK